MMQTPKQPKIRRLIMNKSLPAAALAAVLLFAAAPGAAGYNDDCSQRTARAEHKLHEAIERHGPRSRQAEHWRYELRKERERCWRERRQWWDEHEHRWHHDRDWNDRDH
jgi:hypothetical protein